MLAIRLQRLGRKGHAHYRMVVQDSRRSPKSGNVVASLGSFDPHSKALSLDKEKAAFYLNNGAQPSPRVVRLLTTDGIKMPDWVKTAPVKERTTRNTDKLRKNRPAEPVEEAPVSEEVAEPADAPAETAEEAVEETAAEAAETEEKPAE